MSPRQWFGTTIIITTMRRRTGTDTDIMAGSITGDEPASGFLNAWAAAIGRPPWPFNGSGFLMDIENCSPQCPLLSNRGPKICMLLALWKGSGWRESN
jgi:hypothetical protein